MKYIKTFEQHDDYVDYTESRNYVTPNLSYCIEEDEVHFQKLLPHDYANDYLTFEALEDTVFTLSFSGSSREGYCTQDMRESFSYSVDNGKTWTTFETPNDTYTGTALTTPTIHAGEKVLWKGIGNRTEGKNHFNSSGNFIIKGNVMSLFYGDNFIGNTTLPSISCFIRLFAGIQKLISAEYLILPSYELTNYCYQYLFQDCTSLTTAPELPATTLARACYNGTFGNCTSLTTAPELPATTLANSCYSSMFSYCTSLTTAPELPATTLANSCYSSMFDGCSNLNYIKAMFTTTPGTGYTNYWARDVSATGTFVKNSSAEWDVSGIHGIPEGWTVQTASA